MLPHFITGKAHDRRKQTSQRLADAPERCLSRAPADRIRSIGVKPVFDDVGVKGAQFDGAEVVYALIDFVKRKLFVPASHVHRKRVG